MLRAARLSDLVALGFFADQAAQFLEVAVVAGQNILVAGSAQAGKTTMLNCLAVAVRGGERIVSCEEVTELDFVRAECREIRSRSREIPGRRLPSGATRCLRCHKR